jgi:gamma-glutamyltranspeptidase/glutathione hydrolase
MAAAANPLASEAGRQMLQRGGSAIDAAIAMQAVLTLVEPQATGIGGGIRWPTTARRGRPSAPEGLSLSSGQCPL